MRECGVAVLLKTQWCYCPVEAVLPFMLKTDVAVLLVVMMMMMIAIVVVICNSFTSLF